MRVLIVGGGGREHAIAWSLSKSAKVSEIFCAPGNGGIGQIAKCAPINVMEFERLVEFAKENAIDLTVIGMDAPLAEGIVDAFEENGLVVFGPRKNAAIIESSKTFSKNLMKKYGIPTAAYEVFSDYETALAYINEQKMPIVIKADGLALGKGVIICGTKEEAETALNNIMVKKVFGDAGKTVVVEDFLQGSELSVLCLCDSKTIVPMVSAKDYKKAFNNDTGLNTGGMGSISPCPDFSDDMRTYVYNNICVPTMDALNNEGRPFKGIIYFGLMNTTDGVKVLEYNARFGDPETQAVLPLLETDFFDVLSAVVNENLANMEIKWKNESSCCVVLASGGYPESYESGYEIFGIDDAKKSAFVFHAGTIQDNGKIKTAGGRVLGVTAVCNNAELARKTAYDAAKKISFEKMYYRTDIGYTR